MCVTPSGIDYNSASVDIQYISKEYGHDIIVFCFVVDIDQLLRFYLISDAYAHILQHFLTGTEAIIKLHRYWWSNPEEYG